MKKELRENESLLFDIRGGWFKSKWQMYMGRVFLTDQRLAFRKDNMAALMFGGLLGLFLSKKYAKGFDIEITRDEIASAERSSFGRNKNLVIVKLKSNEEFKFSLTTKVEEFINELNK